MGLGGVPRINGSQPQPNNAASSNAKNQSSFSGSNEFSSTKEQLSSSGALISSQSNNSASRAKKLMKITNKKYRNRKGAPRTMLVDGEIHEVYLLAIA